MIYTASQLIVGDGVSALPQGAVLVDGAGVIQEIGPAAELLRQFPEQPIMEFPGCTLLPGLFDMHVHFGYYYSQPDAARFDDYMVAFYALEQAKQAIRLGITTVRDVSSPHNLCRQLVQAGEKGYFIIPRIFHTDTGICMTGGHGHDDGIPEVDSPWNIRRKIREQLRDGADWIKILTTNRNHIPEYTQEELDAAVDECHRLGVKCAIHAGTHPGIQMSIDAGFDTIEHGTFLTLAQVKQMAAKGLAWTPTMTAYTVLYEFTKEKLKSGVEPGDRIGAKAVRDMAFFEPAYFAYKNNFKSFYDTGVTVLAGSDMVLRDSPPLPINRELALMVECGITPLQAIQTATGNPAKVLGIDQKVGQLKAGLLADMIVVEGNAAQDITTLNRLKEVYQSGQRVYHTESTPE